MSMDDIRIEKIVLNIGCGTTLNVDNAKTVLERLTERTVVVTKAHKRSTFGVPKGKDIGCKITLRKNAKDMLKRLLEAKENTLKEKNFDETGNFAFGIKEYIEIPEMEYDPKLGIIGMDVCVSLEKPGYAVKKRKLRSKVGKKQLIRKEDAIKFVKENFGTTVE